MSEYSARKFRVLSLAALAFALFDVRLSHAQGPTKLESLKQLQTIDLRAQVFHVQGIEIGSDRVWLTSVDRKMKLGYLHVFGIPSAEEIQSIQIQIGDRYHPGGISGDAETLWIPIAPYTRQGTSTIQQRDKKGLKVLSSFEVQDHIGCIAADGERLIGGNWDARLIYYWDKQGKLLDRKENPSSTRYQDMKIVVGQIIASGLSIRKDGEINWLDPTTLKPIRTIIGGATDRGSCYMQEAMAVRDGKLYVVPEDGPSRLFTFELN